MMQAGRRAAGAPSATTPPRPSSWTELLRKHWLFSVLLLTGAGLRGLTVTAYQPVFLLQRDAYTYLHHAVRPDFVPSQFRPVAYSILFLKPLLLTESLLVIGIAQHVLILLLALGLYAMMQRLTVPAVPAAIGTAPILLDGYQIAIEHYILTEAFFQALIVCALLLLAWSVRPHVASTFLSGLLLGLATLTRFAGAVLVVIAVLFLLVRRVGWLRLVALVLAFALPVVGYSFWFRSWFGTTGVTNRNGFFLYGRVASFADCRAVEVPHELERFCFEEPPEQRGPNRGFFALENLGGLAANPRANGLLSDFSWRMIRGQPLEYARVVLVDLMNYFEPRPPPQQEPYVKRWRFPLALEDADPRPFVLRHRGSAPARMGFQPFRIDSSMAARLRAYQDHVYTWGPLLAVLLLVGLGGATYGAVRRPLDRLAWVAALFALSALGLLLFPVATTVYHFRYVIPILPLAGAGGALGAAAFLGARRHPGTPRNGQ